MLPNQNVHPDHWIQDEYVKNQKLPSISAITKSENEKKKSYLRNHYCNKSKN